jgi:hypothetical protein
LFSRERAQRTQNNDLSYCESAFGIPKRRDPRERQLGGPTFWADFRFYSWKESKFYHRPNNPDNGYEFNKKPPSTFASVNPSLYFY